MAEQAAKDELEIPLAVLWNSVDYVVMNPPYSRTRGGQSSFDVAGLSESQRKSCQRRWGRLLQNESAVKTAGMAASFSMYRSEKSEERG